MNPLFDLSGTVSVVIGATGALGGAMARALALTGSTVAVCGRNGEKGRARCGEIESIGGKASFFEVDAASVDSVRRARDLIIATLGEPEILVNAAGGNDPKVTVTPDNPVEAIALENWAASFDLNLVGGALVPCQVFGPGFCALGRGSVINIASVSAHVPLSRVVAYSAAKAATLSLTQFLAREWAIRGVRVNSITPGFFPADQNRALLFQADGSPTPRAAAILGHTPMARFGTPDELAGAVVFLASHQASGFVTGTDLRVDGGFLSQTI
jgi:NAD(P)-dependent dehydrogenase (short-subunit alcohol dehydrogenase family)